MSSHHSRTFTTQSSEQRRAPRRAPRRGQALLLAVLLMVFAALIGSTFITVVALNMDRTSSNEARTAAANAARNGADTINYQLLANGSNWRPEHISPPPAPGDPAYNFYYTPQEIAQGFARISPANTADRNGDTVVDLNDEWIWLEEEKLAGRPVYVKFPDPRSENVYDAPTYLAEVRVERDASRPDKLGMLRIAVVGVSPDNPNVSVTRIGYKGTSEKNGAFSYGMFITDWDYRKQGRVETTGSVSGTTITVTDNSGFEPGRMVALQQGTTVEKAIISAVSSTTLTLKSAPTTITGAVTIRLANPLMNDMLGNGDPIPTPTPVPAGNPMLKPVAHFDSDNMGDHSDDSWDTTRLQIRQAPFSIMSNSDVVFRGKSAFALGSNTKFEAAGWILRNPTEALTWVAPSANPTPVPFPYSNDTNVNAQPGGTALSGVQRQVYDNPNPSAGVDDVTNTTRNVKPVAPPDISQFQRYLELTKYQNGGGQYGYGPGLYIDNAEDVEKVWENTHRPLLVSDSQRLWQGKSFPANGSSGNADPALAAPSGPPVNAPVAAVPAGNGRHKLIFRRLSVAGEDYNYPRAVNNSTSPFSLEQKAIRGWKSPTEFVPRGATLVFDGDRVMVTLEDRSDPVAGDAAPNRPNPAKAWKFDTGGALPGLLGTKTYWMTLDYSGTGTSRTFGVPGSAEAVTVSDARAFNGIIFLEGNVKVRGKIGVKDVTLVSMGNIYIEGNLTRTGTGRIALLAKKNVALNPTQFVSHIRGAQDRDVADRVRLTNPTPGNNVAPGFGIKVANGSSGNTVRLAATTVDPSGTTAAFRVGDLVRVGTDPVWRRVTGINEATNELVLDTSPSPTPAADAPIRLLTDPQIVRGTDNTLYPAPTPGPTPTPPTPVRNELQSPDWFYRVTDNRDGDVFARDIHLDGVPQPVGNGGAYQVPVRMAGEHRVGVMLQYGPTPTPLPPPAPGATPIPTATPMPLLVSRHDFFINPDSDANGQISSQVTPTERRFQSIPAAVPATTPTPIPFNYDLLDANNSGSPEGDTVESIDAFYNAFNVAQNGRWVLKYPAPYATAYTMDSQAKGQATAARRLASLPISSTIAAQLQVNFMAANSPPGSYYKIPLATSVGLFWGNPLISELTPPASLTPPAYIGTSWTTSGTDNAETTSADFYWYRTGGIDTQQWLRWITRTVSPLNADPTLRGVGNVYMLARDAAADAAAPTDDPTLPPLRVMGIKLERDDFAPRSTIPPTYDPVEVRVEATIFAQEGSWFVIPTPVNHRSDLNNNGGLPSNAESAIATRMRRLNYRIRVAGTIMQNFTPLADEDYDHEENTSDTASANYVRGPMAEWLDSSSHPTQIGSISSTGVGQQWQTISYEPGTLAPLDPQLGLARASLLLPLSPKVEFVN